MTILKLHFCKILEIGKSRDVKKIRIYTNAMSVIADFGLRKKDHNIGSA